MKILFFLMLAHFIADFPLQGDFLANMKGKNAYLLFVHSFIWTGCICACLEYFGLFEWWKPAMLLGFHMLVDQWKAMHQDKYQSLRLTLWKDQAFHLLQIIAVL